MRRILITIAWITVFLCGITFTGIAQPYVNVPYGNEWIEFDQSYYKITTAENGFYSLSYSELNQNGIPVNQVDPRNFHLYHRGREQAIIVDGEQDGSFDPGDFIMFYGIKNRGERDSLLYITKNGENMRPHPYFSLYSDSTAYFLTWNNTSGKRIPLQNLSGASSLPEYHYKENLRVFTNRYLYGDHFVNDPKHAMLGEGEGWFGPWIRDGNSDTYTLGPVDNIYEGGPRVTFSLLIAGVNGSRHDVEVVVGSGNQSTFTMSSSGRTTRVLEGSVPVDHFNASNELPFQITAVSGSNNSIAPGYIKIKTPQVPEMNSASNKVFNFINTTGTPRLDIANPPVGARVFDVSDRNNIVEYAGNVVGDTLRVTFNGGKSRQSLRVRAGTDNLLQPGKIEPVTFEKDGNERPEFLIITHKKFLQAANAYASYREQTGLNTKVVTMDRLYNQYNYGEKGPLATYGFCRFMVDSARPDFLFFIGKGVNTAVAKGGYRQSINGDVESNYVPTAGNPGSEIIFTSGLGGEDHNVPAVPTGRLSAWTEQHVYNYLNKVKQNAERGFNELWRKDLLHLSGGRGESQQEQFLGYSRHFESLARGPLFGADVETISKTTNKSTEFINISNELNEGKSLVMFFGHSAPGTADIDWGYVSEPVNNYHNKGKYPVFLVNGCDVGNIYYSGPDSPVENTTISEDWMFAKNKGAINFISHSDKGFTGSLREYTDDFYDLAFNDSLYMTKSIGEIQKETIQRFAGNSSSIYKKAHAQQIVLQGDPAVKPFPQGPDYATKGGHIFVEGYNGTNVTADVDSFKLGVVVTNYGMAVTDSVQISVERKVNQEQYGDYGPFTFSPVYRRDTFYITIPNGEESAYGNNIFTVSIDPDDRVKEMNEMNNEGVLEYYMAASGVRTLMPSEFSIVGKYPVTLVAQATDLLAQRKDYVVEWDTTHTFDSPVKEDTLIHGGPLVQWTPSLIDSSLIARDSLVYFWRVREKEINDPRDTAWSRSSFTYIPGQTGWSQSHEGEFQRDQYQGISVSENGWHFDSTFSNLYVETVGSNGGSREESKIFVNDVLLANGHKKKCADNGLIAVVFDKTTGVPYRPVTDLGCQCGYGSGLAYAFPPRGSNLSNTQPQEKLKELIGSVRDGDYVLLMSVQNAHYDSWQASLKDSIRTLGAEYLDSLENKEPYILLGKKNQGKVQEVEAASFDNPKSAFITLNEKIVGKNNYSNIRTPRIGPTDDWKTLLHQIRRIDQKDGYQLRVYGETLQGEDSLLYNNVQNRSFALNQLNTTNYRYLRLEGSIYDSLNLTPPQLESWRILYSGAPEGVLNTDITGRDEYRNISTKYQGDSVKLDFAFQNVSAYDFSKPLIVEYSIRNESGQSNTIRDTLRSLPAGDTLFFSKSISTVDYTGKNSYRVFVNPREQTEVDYSNNIISGSFEVERDKVHPIIDVTIDGKHIMDGDIVSPSPDITISLRDENKHMPKRDTSGFELYLKGPDSENEKGDPIHFSDEAVKSWRQSPGNNNYFEIEYRPDGLKDGTYTLIVRGEDVSGNKSGSKHSYYRVSFKVINEVSMTHFYPYPNPFSNNMRFAYTITGRVPDDIRIQILTVSGKVVRTFTKEELGPLRVGKHLTDFSWDGTDQFGDKLANGVYLYRVQVRNDGEDVKHRSTQADDTFKKNFGKLYIMR